MQGSKVRNTKKGVVKVKKMKWLFLSVGIVLAAAGILTAVKMYRDTIPEETDDIDGGVVRHNDGVDAPKVIESTEIVEFICEFSLLTTFDPGELGNNNYKLRAFLTDDVVEGSFKKWGRNCGDGENDFTFVSDSSFMTKLQEIVSKHDFAGYNGYTHTVSGLPHMYGAKLDIRYDSGESIYAYNNKDCFLSYEAMHDLAALFHSMNEQ